MKLEQLFDAQARERIAAAVKAAEAKTVGQIVPVVVARARDYHGFQRGLGFLPLALGLQLGLAQAFPDTLGVTSAELLIVVGTWVLFCALPPVTRLFEHHDYPGAVHQRALAAFIDHGVHETREGTGVLVFVSVHERRAVILGNRAIHQKMTDEGWKQAVDALLAGLGKGDAAGGFVAAIALVGDKLAQHFPRTGVPVPNELSDELRIERE